MIFRFFYFSLHPVDSIFSNSCISDKHQSIHQWKAFYFKFSFNAMYTSQFKEMDPYDWICGPGSHDLLSLSPSVRCWAVLQCVKRSVSVWWSSEHHKFLRSWNSVYNHTVTQNCWMPRLSTLVTLKTEAPTTQMHMFGCVLMLLFCSVIVSSSRDILFTHECLIHGCHVQLAYIGWWRCLGCVFGWALLGCIPFSAISPGDGVTAWASLQCQCGKENIRPSSPNECYTKPTAGHKDRYVHIHIP